LVQDIREESFRKIIQANCEQSRGREQEDVLHKIGSVWNGNVPYLDNWNDKRKLNLNDWNDRWNRDYQFAAVRNVLKNT